MDNSQSPSFHLAFHGGTILPTGKPLPQLMPRSSNFLNQFETGCNCGSEGVLPLNLFKLLHSTSYALLCIFKIAVTVWSVKRKSLATRV